MKVLADYHHHDLWESLELLLTDRFGWELYRPIGLEWFHAEYWNHERKWHGDAIARQYLEPWGDDDPVLGRHDRSHPNRWHKLLTLEQAREAEIDLVISTLAHNHEGMARFAAEIGATFAIQIGNVRFGAADMAEDRWDLAKFGLVSGVMPVAPSKPHIVYHQEFDLNEFRPTPPLRFGPLVISSFVQCYPQTTFAYERMTASAEAAPEFHWKVYGAYGSAPIDRYAAGNIDRCADVAKAMRQSDIAWHAKKWSDGYGHVLHNWAAIGRPLFGYEEYYRDQLGGPLWVDGVTSFDIGRRTTDEVVQLLRMLAQDGDVHRKMCEAMAARFREIVNFDAEAEAIRALIEGMVE